MKILHRRSTRHDHPLIRQCVRAATSAALFVLVCLASLASTSTPAATEPPPVAESSIDTQETTREGDDDTGVASSLPSGGHSTWYSSGASAQADAPLAPGQTRRVVAPPRQSSTLLVDEHDRRCFSDVLLSSIRPRAPTSLA